MNLLHVTSVIKLLHLDSIKITTGGARFYCCVFSMNPSYDVCILLLCDHTPLISLWDLALLNDFIFFLCTREFTTQTKYMVECLF